MAAKKIRIIKAAAAVSLLVVLSSCGLVSRYRLDLFVSSGDTHRKVAVEHTQFVKDAVLGDPYGESKMVAGEGHVAVVTVGTRWDSQESKRFTLLGFDQYWRCRIYLQLSADLGAGRVSLE
ncbi:MAG: hypothetical protein JSW34_06370, partial [Candidatus Zixiibacteriota bacterium]